MDPIKAQSQQEAKLHFLDYWRIIRIRKTVILAVFLLVVITATLVTFILPQTFSSTVRIKVERDIPDVPGLTESRMIAGSYDPYFIQTEFETIRSEVVLGKVVSELDLNNVWGRKMNGGQPLKTTESIGQLKKSLNPQAVRNTTFIEISFQSDDPEEAARVANKVAEAYRDYRTQQRVRLSKSGIKALEGRLDQQIAKVNIAQSNLAFLREKLNIPDMYAAVDTPSMLMSAETLRKLEALRIEGQADYKSLESLVRTLTNLPPDQLKMAIPTAMPDSLLSSLLEQYSMAMQRYLLVTNEYGIDHTEVKKARGQLDELQAQVALRVEGVIKGLDARLVSLREKVSDLESEVSRAQSNDQAQARISVPYFDAKRELEEVQRFRQILEMKIVSEDIDMSLPKTAMVEIMDPAQPNLTPVKPKKTLNISLGIIIGLVVGIGLAFFIEYLDTSVKTIDDVERSLQSPVLGVIPQNVGLLLEEGADSPHAEAYRVLRTNLLFSRKDDKLNTVAVVSAGAGEGKSTTVFNLAAVFAQSRQRTLVVDSDLRRPTLHKMMGVSNSLGLTNYLLKQNTLEEVIQTTPLPTLDFLSSGKLPSSSLGILSSSQMKDLINELKQRYDFVFFDSPPIMGVSDASILASEVDMTLQVIQYRRYPQPMNIRAKQLIEKVGGNLVGIVLNNINMSQDESYYYYSGYYHDYYSRNDEEAPATRDDASPGEKS